MKDLSELWVGDKLRIHESAHVGTFRGVHTNGQAIIEMEGQIITVPKEFIDIVQEALDDPRLTSSFSIEEHHTEENNKVTFDESKIDLHIEKLAPEMAHTLPERLRSFQVEKAKIFIEKMIATGNRHFTIIHGKGTGILKLEINHLLENYAEVGFVFDRNDGGATEIWLK